MKAIGIMAAADAEAFTNGATPATMEHDMQDSMESAMAVDLLEARREVGVILVPLGIIVMIAARAGLQKNTSTWHGWHGLL